MSGYLILLLGIGTAFNGFWLIMLAIVCPQIWKEMWRGRTY